MTFKDINTHYRDGQSFQTGHRGLGDGRRIHLSSPTASLESASKNIITLDAGDVTGASFIKVPERPIMRGDLKKVKDVITNR